MRKILDNKNNYIICAIVGGLGNQILQYIFAKSLAKKLNCKLILDISFSKLKIPYKKYKKKNPNKFLLDQFKIKDVIYNFNIFKFNFLYLHYLKHLNFFLIKNLINFFFNIKINNFYYDNSFKKKEIFKNICDCKYKKTSYFYGYWQNIFNSKLLDKEVIKEIFLKKKIIFNKKCFSKKNIAIHIRGNDYLFKKNHKINIADESYYNKCIQFFLKKISNPQFHVYSDDICYAKKILKHHKYKEKIFFKKKNNEIYDFEKLRKYYNYIIPNSTFSYSAALINYNKYKCILIPKKWDLFKEIKLPKNIYRI